MWHGEPLNILNKDSLKSWFNKRFDFLRKPKPTVPYVRRRLRFAWLWRFFDLWPSVKKEFFDRQRQTECEPSASVFVKREG